MNLLNELMILFRLADPWTVPVTFLVTGDLKSGRGCGLNHNDVKYDLKRKVMSNV